MKEQKSRKGVVSEEMAPLNEEIEDLFDKLEIAIQNDNRRFAELAKQYS